MIARQNPAMAREGIVIYECTSHSSNMTALKQYATQKLFFSITPTLQLVLRIPNQSSTRHLRQIGDKPIGVKFDVAWMKGTPVSDTSMLGYTPTSLGSDPPTILLCNTLCKESRGLFTHGTEDPQPLHFKHSHWWKRQSQSKFAASHHA